MRWEFVAIPNFKIVVVKAKAPSLDAAIQLTHSSSQLFKKKVNQKETLDQGSREFPGCGSGRFMKQGHERFCF